MRWSGISAIILQSPRRSCSHGDELPEIRENTALISELCRSLRTCARGKRVPDDRVSSPGVSGKLWESCIWISAGFRSQFGILTAPTTDCTFAIVERSCLSQVDIITETSLSNREGRIRQYNPNPAGSQHNSNETESQRTHGSCELSEAHLQILSAENTLARRINRRLSFSFNDFRPPPPPTRGLPPAEILNSLASPPTPSKKALYTSACPTANSMHSTCTPVPQSSRRSSAESSIRGKTAFQSAAWSSTATGLESSDTLISTLRRPVSHSSDCSIARAPINQRQEASLQKIRTTRLFLLYDLRQKRLTVHNGPCASTTLPLLLGPVRRYLQVRW